ncbi:hypothetical protein EPO15_09755 [bacterium]|nr:MAG: hypothetical protein EPO15_09755 [bacterium]
MSVVTASGVRFELAGPADDPGLRALLRAMPMGTGIRVTFEREPSYFSAARLQGEVQVPVARDPAGRVLGMGLRAFSPAWRGGAAAEAGYLADLRLLPEHRGGTLLARGYRFLRELHADRRAAVYATMLVADNAVALSTIAAGRAGLPLYRDLGRYLSPSILLGARPTAPRLPGVGVERGSLKRLPDIVAALNAFGREREFAPVHAEADFLPGGRWPGLRPEDFFLAVRGGRVVGTLARWDQGSFRQTRVHGYSPALEAARRLARPFARLPAPARLRLAARLPVPGALVPHLYAAFPSAEAPAVLRLLIDALRADAAGGPHLYAVLGLSERDPLASALSGVPQVPFAGRLFAVHFSDGRAEADALAGRIPYLEAGAL